MCSDIFGPRSMALRRCAGRARPWSVLRPQLQARRGLFQESIELLHAQSGMPWWATIASSTVMLRTCLLPLVIAQIRAGAGLPNAQPNLVKLRGLLQKAIAEIPAHNVGERLQKCRLSAQGVLMTLRLHQINPLMLIAPPLTHIPGCQSGNCASAFCSGVKKR